MEQSRSAADRIAPAVVSALPAGALPVATGGPASAHPPKWWPVGRPAGAPHDRAALAGPRERGWRSDGVLTRSAAASRLLVLPSVGRFRDSARARLSPPAPDTAPTAPPAVDAPAVEAQAAVTPYRLVTRAPFGARTHRS
ncbi:hypothetical protein ACWD7F_39200, partial [Streptomyces sp. NPDC005122]